jgi:predicted transporter
MNQVEWFIFLSAFGLPIGIAIDVMLAFAGIKLFKKFKEKRRLARQNSR